MLFQDRNQLTIVECEKDSLTFEELLVILSEKPKNVIYVEEVGKLKGIISTGDIFRAGKEGKREVKINTNFMRLSVGDYVKARMVFEERPTINALPTVDENGVLVGNYTRWNDCAWMRCNISFMKQLFKTKLSQIKENVIFIKPRSREEETQRLFRELEKIGIGGVKLENLFDLDNIETVLFYDEDEMRVAFTIHEILLEKQLVKRRYITCKQYYSELQEQTFYDRVNAMFAEMQGKGIRVLGFDFEPGVYLEQLHAQIKEKYEIYGVEASSYLHEELKKEFLDDLYDKTDDKLQLPFLQKYRTECGMLKIKDRDEFWCHVENSIRRTENQPEKYDRTIYLYGPCIVFGAYTDDGHTIASFLQKLVCEDQQCIKVINKGGPIRLEWYLQELAMTEFKSGDIVLLFLDHMPTKDIRSVDLTKICEENRIPANFFVNNELHCNHKVNKVIADAFYEEIKKLLGEEKRLQKISAPKNLLLEEYLGKYFADFYIEARGKTGAIVMNCNPFTQGHRYLIEEACCKVDTLIIFVVQENESYFSFEERFIMVQEGVRDLKKVIVVPSGNLILSKFVFPEYFVKLMDEDIIENAENDVRYFGEVISKRLNITCRFVGEEPEDAVTNQYNVTMKKILPTYGVEVLEIPRKTVDERVVSASSVRNYLLDGKGELVCNLVPETTRKILGL